MNIESEVIHVEGLARMLGRTDASIREGIRRGVSWLPKSFKMGNRHCWLKENVREFLREYSDGEHKKPKLGRKRREPPSLKDAQKNPPQVIPASLNISLPHRCATLKTKGSAS